MQTLSNSDQIVLASLTMVLPDGSVQCFSEVVAELLLAEDAGRGRI